jgi:ElaB/YqjD/DUF883 family membrane-anchored ribosome-binding protein
MEWRNGRLLPGVICSGQDYFVRRRTELVLLRYGMVDGRQTIGAPPASLPRGDLLMPTSFKNATDQAEDAITQIARLREQVETLMRDKVAPAMGDAAERVEAAAHDAADVMRDRASALSGVVRDRPLAAICIAAVVGFLLGRTGR